MTAPSVEGRDPQALFVEHLPGIDRIIGVLGRRHHLAEHESEDFGSWAKLRLIENDYAAIRKFRGESSMLTYLSVVIAMLYREYRAIEGGRWRSSAAARRCGDLGVRLESMVLRDRVAVRLAGEMLRTSGATKLSDTELARLVQGFPRRTWPQTVSMEPESTDLASTDRADGLVDHEEGMKASAAVGRALSSAFAMLDPQERLLVRMRFVESMTVANIARALQIPQKPLYVRLDRALLSLRRSLEQSGVTHTDVSALGEFVA
ncbi:MAG: polymerase sigma factor, sigma-70 family [Myxococcales bacterium]|nr:polymerase sigma factor, sigma-70 family [Myxococcales bacterium]